MDAGMGFDKLDVEGVFDHDAITGQELSIGLGTFIFGAR